MLNEADRIPSKHLFTLEDGISPNQFREMTDAGVRLVVPEEHFVRFKPSIRSRLTSLGNFIEDIKALGVTKADQPSPRCRR